MMNRFLLLPLLALCLMTGACLTDAQVKNDVAVVDIGRLIRDSEPGKAAQAFLESIQKDFNDKLAAQQEKVQQNQNDKQAMQTLETMYVSMQQRMQTEEQNATNVLIEQILQTVKNFRQQKNYKVIVRTEALLDYDPACDVTGLVLDEVNKLKIDFKPVTGEQDLSGQDAAAESEAQAETQAAPVTQAEPAQAAEPAAKPAAEPAQAAEPAAKPATEPAQAK